MDIYSKLHSQQPYRSNRYDEYFGGLKTAVFDIETTGLYPQSSKIITGGLLIHGNNDNEVIQYFADSKDEEKELLALYVNALSEADVLISYNGNAFDLPFLKHRLNHYGLYTDLDSCLSFDLYRALHYYSPFRNILPDLKQKSIEKYLGISVDRKDEITGLESVHLYNEYCRNGTKEAKEKVLLHNYDDLVQLSAIIKILDKLDLHKIMYYEGFSVVDGRKRICVKNISFGRKSLTVNAVTRNLPMDYYSFDAGFQAVHLASQRTLTLEIPFEKLHGAEFIDLDMFAADFSELEKFPHYADRYLVMRKDGNINYAEINAAVKTLLKEIIKFY